ncbi:MAG: rod shape-determining protein MreC [Candidatus Omnitrophica bacterium]|nr:rod shape-determining protein MreC [Candidatus Omnitrophota bacterium]
MRFKQFLFFLLLILTPLFVGIYSPGTVRFGRDMVFSLFQPFLQATHQTVSWFSDQKNSLFEMFQLRENNQKLLEQVQILKQELVVFKEMKTENERLKRLLDFKQASEWKTVSAQVIARDLSHWSYYVMINKGSSDGIQSEMPVASGEGLVGKVVSVAPHSARVILLIDSDSRVSALLQETRDVGLVEGMGESFLKMTYLDLTAQVQVGQTVISSGLGGVYPKGIPIGKVIQIGEEKDKLSLYAMVQPFSSFSKLEEVLCLKTDILKRSKET